MRYVFFLLLLSFTITSCIKDSLSIQELKCEYISDPLGIDIPNPRLSWKICSDKNGQKQTAFHILVASSNKLLKEDKGDLWNTGKIESGQSVQIVYGGEKLEPQEQVFWKVRVWDREGKQSAWSKTAKWEMGLNPSDWKAKWTGAPVQIVGDAEKMNPAIYFRKRIHLSSQVKKARVYVCGLGYYELYINGKKVGDHVLSPNHTNYDRRQSTDFGEKRTGNMSSRVLYETYDVTSCLRKGENIAAICLGNGWYFQNDREEDKPYSYDKPRFIAQFELEFMDGSRELILSDDSWKTSLGPILHNGLYNGEIYDARLEKEGWNNIDFGDDDWNKAKIVRPPKGNLVAQMSPPDRIIKTIDPVSFSNPEKGLYRYDLGQMISGWARLKVKGPRGTKITFKFIEELGPGYGQTDMYILKGGVTEIWEPRFTWHAFRYIDVSSTIPLTIDNIVGVVVNTDVDSAGTLLCSNNLFNKIIKNYQWTQLGNMHGGIPSDCPHRERRGYTGDGQIVAQAAIYNFNMASFYSKWLNDIKDAQNAITGYVPNTVPYQSGGGGTAWGSAYVIIPWYMYLYYSDISILEQHYPGMKKWIDWLESQTGTDGIIDEENLGEWVPPEPTEIPPSLVSTAYYYHNLKLMSAIAEVLNKSSDSAYYMNHAKKTKKAFNKKYFSKERMSYSIGRQGANVFALGFGLVPENLIMKVFKSLVRNIESNTDEHFDTGMMGTPLVLDVLTRYGRMDLAYSLMNQHDYPGFGYAINQGATTIWETWRGDASHSHPMFGSVCQWFYQGLAGINPDPENPGFRNIIIKPQPVRNLEYVTATHTSVYGNIESGWQWKGNNLFLDISIPANSTATVILPATEPENVTINNLTAKKNKDVSLVEFKDHLAKYQVESGDYRFISGNIRNLMLVSRLSVPKILPADSLLFFPDTAIVEIYSNEKDIVLRYTLNGNEPDEQSPVYSKPLRINSNTTIKAKAFKPGTKPSSYKKSSLTFINPDINGLRYQYYEGDWERVPDFTSFKPKRTGTIYEIGLDNIPFKQEKFGLVLKGSIEIRKNALYTFHLNSNDGSKLYIDGKLVIDNDGMHGAVEKEGEIKLSEGKHSIQICYFQVGGGFHLKVYISGTDIEKTSIPASMLFIPDK